MSRPTEATTSSPTNQDPGVSQDVWAYINSTFEDPQIREGFAVLAGECPGVVGELRLNAAGVVHRPR